MASEAARCSKMVKQTLTRAFPGVKFSVTSEYFSGGNSVDIRWTDGPTSRDVRSLVGQHQVGHFDGMIDLYEYSNRRDDIPQVKFVSCHRDLSDDLRRAALHLVNKTYGWDLQWVEKSYRGRSWIEIDPSSDRPMDNGRGWRSWEVNRVADDFHANCHHCHAAILPGDAYCPMCGQALYEKEAA